MDRIHAVEGRVRSPPKPPPILAFMTLYIWLYNLKEWTNGLISNKAQKSQLHNSEILEIEQNYDCKAVSWIDHNFLFFLLPH